MKAYVHARLRPRERALLKSLRDTTGQSDSELVRRGLILVAHQERERRSALDLVAESAGRFEHGPPDLSMNRRHLDGFGE